MLDRGENEKLPHYILRLLWRNIKCIRSYTSYIKFKCNKPTLKPGNNPIPITVSFTTYPARMKWLPIVVGSLVRQSRQPDRIVLYLSKEQFKDTNAPVFQSIKKQGVQVQLRDGDLRSHKKYYYAMQEYPDNLIITVDDDIVYDKNMIEDLYQSFLRHPNAVSGKRVHRIKFDTQKQVLPYCQWEDDSLSWADKEDMNLIATGCGGILYPPECVDRKIFDLDGILYNCINADDIWLKLGELLVGTPTVLAKSKCYKLVHIWGTECEGLALSNVEDNGNDLQLKKACEYLGINLWSRCTETEGIE